MPIFPSKKKQPIFPLLLKTKCLRFLFNCIYIYLYDNTIFLIICFLASKLKHLGSSHPKPSTPSHRSGPPARPLHSWQVRSSILPNNLREKRHLLESRPCGLVDNGEPFLKGGRLIFFMYNC